MRTLLTGMQNSLPQNTLLAIVFVPDLMRAFGLFVLPVFIFSVIQGSWCGWVGRAYEWCDLLKFTGCTTFFLLVPIPMHVVKYM